ncbi:uncharacterized protein K452DRAFT_298391 [Aplosporella prunicola CBS 121167]|uniref:Uncharacterized protein n=1 Tax=Aplosporella prunicola CBS 121167 TaxID=1176127 RepID=A0A6A6BEB1_9PEZI|nr:uncharacterized protein K452DRAFT_298391 [Aplosporella prunicola CBS 121167]KAF2141723.1 hypothetical protein K452DRAFT_298391 [Aplosporella prunicola CBS 121167]
MAQASDPSSPTQPPFDPVDTSTPDGRYKDEVESPSVSNSNALARFEFEAGQGREGTKILMVEWEDDEKTKGVRGDWHISWEGKSTVLPANDQTPNVNRLYFLLAPGAAVPPTITLMHRPADPSKSPTTWRTNPLPAIFPPELGASGNAAGKKGVLHTIWAKRRLQELQKEIEAEGQSNVEGIGFVMVMQEKEWIEQNFGVSARPSVSFAKNEGSAPLSPSSPRSPGGGRLMDKLKGLKLNTTEKDFSTRKDPSEGMPAFNPLSPESSDVAVSSFATFKGLSPAELAAKPAQVPSQPQQQQQQDAPRRVAAPIAPPAFIQQQQSSAMGSLDAFAGGFQPLRPQAQESHEEEKDDLFAVPISPRSPEMKTSPFSFAAADTAKYAGEEKAS